ncbi:CapA family protein [Alicyclobacillus curvatus]|nr:CapA family protein [Alicyclobacillus curvatus]
MKTIHIAAVGDVLMWRRQIASAKQEGGRSYAFDPMFREVAPYLRGADLTIGNLETTFSGREPAYQKRNQKTGWPMFNCPDELAGALRRAGFNVLTTANNHCMDRGIRGLKRTLGVLDRHGLRHTGTYRSRSESAKLLVANVKGVRVGVLAYTYGTNNIPVPRDSAWAVNRIWPTKIENDIARMKKHADLVIVVLHFGQEFHRFPNDKQKSLVKRLFYHGADVVLGVHPHVLQPMSLRSVRERSGRVAKKFVIYSLGNFISDRMLGNIHSDSGVIVNLTVTKDDKGVTSVQAVRTIPTWVHKFQRGGGTRFRVLPVGRFLKKPDQRLTREDIKTMRRVGAATSRHLRS